MRWDFFVLLQVYLLWGGGFARAQGGANSEFEAITARAAAALRAHPDEAANLYRQALAMRPDWAEGWFDLGGALYQTSRFVEAKAAFDKAAALAPDNGAVLAFRGLCENRLKEGDAALADIRRAETLGLPDDAGFVSQVRNCGADLCIRKRKFTEAVQQLRPLAQAGNESPETIAALGISALGIPYEPEEVPAGNRPLVQAAGRAMWALFSDRGDPGDLFRKLIADYGAQPGVHYLAGVYWLPGDPQKARGEFENELKVSPSSVPALLQIAILDIHDGNAPGALELGKQALKLEPDNSLAHAVIGRAYEHSGDYSRAVLELEKASKLAPENAQLHFSLSQAYSHLGRHADAEKQLAEFKRLKNGGGAEQVNGQ